MAPITAESTIFPVAREGAERRLCPRVALCVEVGFLSDSNFYAGFTEDVSEGGLFVATHLLKDVGTELTLTFTLPNEHVVTAAGVVRWLRDPHDLQSETAPGMGIQLLKLSAEDLAMVQQFVALRAPLFYDVD
jgi:uncharacterized protein (TIGR02266 family)